MPAIVLLTITLRTRLLSSCHVIAEFSHGARTKVLCLQVYGYQGIKSGQSSEHLVGKFAKQKTKPVVIGTKFFTIPWTNFLVGGGFRLGRQSMIKALRASLQRLGQDKIDLYQVGSQVVLLKHFVMCYKKLLCMPSCHSKGLSIWTAQFLELESVVHKSVQALTCAQCMHPLCTSLIASCCVDAVCLQSLLYTLTVTTTVLVVSTDTAAQIVQVIICDNTCSKLHTKPCDQWCRYIFPFLPTSNQFWQTD